MNDLKRAVIVEDDFLISEYLSQLCRELGVGVVGTAMEADGALHLIREEAPGYVLMDVRLGAGKDGVDVANMVHQDLPDTKIIFITGSNEPVTLARIDSDHPFRVLIKPINRDHLREAFELT